MGNFRSKNRPKMTLKWAIFKICLKLAWFHYIRCQTFPFLVFFLENCCELVFRFTQTQTKSKTQKQNSAGILECYRLASYFFFGFCHLSRRLWAIIENMISPHHVFSYKVFFFKSKFQMSSLTTDVLALLYGNSE